MAYCAYAGDRQERYGEQSTHDEMKVPLLLI